jgi:hypothetical protein
MNVSRSIQRPMHRTFENLRFRSARDVLGNSKGLFDYGLVMKKER